MPKLLVLLICFLNSAVFSQSPYIISGFGNDTRSFTPSDNKIIQPLSGESLTEVKSFPSLKPGEVVLRIRYSATDYRLYHGILASTAFDPAVSLFSFELPASMSGSKAVTIKFYKEEATNPDLDEAMLYFDNNRIYARFLPRLFYNDGTSWKTIDAVNMSGDNKKQSRPMGDLQITSTPDHAEIFIDGKSTGVFTPNYVSDLFEGTHNLTLRLKNFQTIDTVAEVKSGKITPLSVRLKSALGSLTLTSIPSGATVKINGVKNGITPLTINDVEPGDYVVEMEYDLYKSASSKMIVGMNRNAKWEAKLEPDFGTINLPETPKEVTINIDGKESGKDSVKLNPGMHHLHLSGGGMYAEIDTNIVIKLGQIFNIKVKMKRLTGSIKVMPLPMDAEIIINNKSYGIGSRVIDSLPTGKYTIVCKKSGYEDGKQTVEVKDGEIGTVRFTLSEKRQNVQTQSSSTAENVNTIKEIANTTEVPANNGEVPEEYVWIPGGTFMMGLENGSNDEKPVHKVTLSGFYMKKTEVTQEEYEREMGGNPSKYNDCPTCPVENVTWNEAKEYCEKVGGRLPTEAEWEYACRAGSTTKYYWGDEMDGDYAWYDDNSGPKNLFGKTKYQREHPVAQKKPNAFGLYDMSGNVWEWCNDFYNETYYSNSQLKNPQGPATGESRIIRGGSYKWWDHSLRSTDRGNRVPVSREVDVGFRCVRSR